MNDGIWGDDIFFLNVNALDGESCVDFPLIIEMRCGMTTKNAIANVGDCTSKKK